MRTQGRTTIYANYTEKQLLSGNKVEQEKKILDIIENSLAIHENNKIESQYLIDYLYGTQDISEKIKLTRTDINNKGVENWAWATQDLKKALLVGQPIKYAPLDNIPSKEIQTLNKYLLSRHKEKLDQDIYEDIFTVGRGYRYSWTNNDKIDETPFDTFNLDVLNTEVVYSSSIKHEQLLSYIEVPQMANKKVLVDNKWENLPYEYNEYTVYTRKNIFIVNNKSGKLKIIDSKPNIYNVHIITEYYFNKYRVSLLELVKDIYNDINDVENFDKDDIENFVNAVMVFTNAKIDKEKMDAIKEYGAISIKSTNDKKASVEFLQTRLKANETQSYYLRKLYSLFEILGIPQPRNDGENNAETGKAMLISQGFTSANMRVENEEKAFKRADRQALNVILAICKEKEKSKIKKINSNDIDIIFSRDLSDNIMTKTQSLRDLYEVKIPPEIANTVVHLFSDPVAVTNLQKDYIKELEKKEEEKQEKYNLLEEDKKIEDNKITN